MVSSGRAVRCSLLLVVAMLFSVSALAQTNVTSVQPGFAIDFAGEWAVRNNEDPGQPPLGDFLGIPFNEAGRMRAETSAESIWGSVEYQCRPHSAPHQWRGVGGSRIIKEVDPMTRTLEAYTVEWWRSMRRPIYMDGRPHPPAWAPHTWTGFSTGEWVGNTLKVTTTHLKDGYLKRSGPQTSDMYTMTEYITRHGDFLTVFLMVDDPVYLEEPFVLSITHRLNPETQLRLEPCTTSFAENGGSDRHWVPHYLPGQNTFLTEWLEDENWIPEEAALGGVRTIYPEYQLELAGGPEVTNPPVSASAVSIDEKVRAQSPRDGQIHVMPVQGNVYMLVVDGTNIAVSVGADGALLANTGPEHMADQVIQTVNELVADAVAARPNNCMGLRCSSNPAGWSSPYIHSVIASPAPARPIRYIMNTNASADLTGGNAEVAAAGYYPRGGGNAGAVAGIGQDAMIIAHENVLLSMSAPTGDVAPTLEGAWPTDTFFDEFYKLSQYFNGEPVIAYHQPNATTDGDSLVFFRHSEVIHAGDIYSTVSYPYVDIENGGSIDGVIAGLNGILDMAVAENRSQGGTWIIPSHGRLSDTADVASYRNMVTMARDRIRAMVNNGMTLEQVLDARPTLDFDGRYGSVDEDWTTEMFIEAAYRSLSQQ
jgi:glyoxylase-like metal-dependent hydrolase (beta-lactamase superfamily II)